MSNFEYKGVTISLNANGEFTARVGAQYVTKATLTAIKKEIDSTNAFEVFDAFYTTRYSDSVLHGQIVGIVRARGKKTKWNKDKWLTKSGAEEEKIVRDTPENRALVQTVERLEKEYRAARKAVEDRYFPLLEKARDAVPWEEVPQ